MPTFSAESIDEENLESLFYSIDDKPDSLSTKVDGIEKKDFIEAVKNDPALNERFENLECINVKKLADGTIVCDGVTSVVFMANDATDDRKVAVKVLDKSKASNQKLDTLIEWESRLLELVKNKKYCQQLRTPYTNLSVNAVGKVFPTSYLATIYLKTDIRRFFFKGDKSANSDLLKKLIVFISVLNAIKALHSMEICHRDIKPENFRANTKDGKSVVVAIDLGLALVSPAVRDKVEMYSPKAHGTQEYAAPEKLCGFENEYELGKGADIYSLGCLLYELVCKDLFYEQFKLLNKNCYCRIMNDCKVYQTDGNTLAEKLSVYNSHIDRDFSQLQLPHIPPNLEIPEYVRKELQHLIERLCCLDYRKRIKSEEIEDVKKKLRSIIKSLENTKRYSITNKRNKKEAV